MAELSTSSAHRERVFLEERLVGVKRDLDQASEDFSQFAGEKNKTIDLKEEARAMLQGAATIEGQLIEARIGIKRASGNLYRQQCASASGSGPD